MAYLRIICLLLCFLKTCTSDTGYSKGRQFVAAFMYNYGDGSALHDSANYLFITSQKVGNVFVEMAQVGHIPAWRHNVSLSPGQAVRVALPEQSEFRGKSVLEKRGVHVYSDVDISVYAMNDDVSKTSADAALILPVTSLSMNYVVSTPASNPVLLVAGLIPGTQVTVQLKSSCSISYKGRTYTSGSNITEILGNQDVLQLLPKLVTNKASTCSLSGTRVTATHPIGVFTGSACAYRSTVFRSEGCGFEMQQVIPDELVGKRFIVPDMMDNQNYVVRIIATSESIVNVDVHHKDGTVHNMQLDMDAGEWREVQVPDGSFLEVFSFKGVHVTQFDGTSAPFSNPIPAVESYGWNYTISTMNNPTSSNFANFVNIAVNTSSAHTVTIDGKVLDQSKWRRVRDLGYSVGTFPISAGSHRIEASTSFMMQVYGYDGAASYCFQAGYFFKTLPSAHLGAKDYPPVAGGITTTPIPGTCMDSPGVNCQVLDSTIFVCSNPSSAGTMCKKTCNLCQGCTNPSCVVG